MSTAVVFPARNDASNRYDTGWQIVTGASRLESITNLGATMKVVVLMVFIVPTYGALAESGEFESADVLHATE